MSRKSRAQQDAERLAALEEDQRKIESGEVAIEDVEARLSEEVDPTESGEPEYETPAAPIIEQKPAKDDVEELKHQLANMKRTLSLYEQELNPAQKLAQKLERENEELRAKLAAAPPVPEGPTDYGLTEEESEFDTVKSISEKVSKAHNAKIMKELESLKKTIQAFEEAKTQLGVDQKISEHKTALSKALGGDNPDDLFANPKLSGWMENQTEEEILALRNPIMYSPRFVAGVLTRFKAEALKGQAERRPSHGESAVPSRVAPDTVVRSSGSQESGPVFNAGTFQRDVQKLIASGNTRDAEKLIKAAERAMSA